MWRLIGDGQGDGGRERLRPLRTFSQLGHCHETFVLLPVLSSGEAGGGGVGWLESVGVDTSFFFMDSGPPRKSTYVPADWLCALFVWDEARTCLYMVCSSM